MASWSTVSLGSMVGSAHLSPEHLTDPTFRHPCRTADWIGHINYLHYNPVEHGPVQCPHQWEYSSFRWFASEGFYEQEWGYRCRGRSVECDSICDDLEVGE